MVKEVGMHADPQFLGQRRLGSVFPPGTEAEKEGVRESLQSLSLPVLLLSSPRRRRLVREEAGKDFLRLRMVSALASSSLGVPRWEASDVLRLLVRD